MDYRNFLIICLKKRLKSFLTYNITGNKVYTVLEPYLRFNKPYALCLSTGPDSLLFLNLVLYNNNFRFVVMYFNHKKRVVESSSEQGYVFFLSKAYNLQFYSSKTPNSFKLRGSQNYLKALRDCFFNKTLLQKRCFFSVTAHHMDDSLEGNLLRLNRSEVKKRLAFKLVKANPLFWVFKDEVNYLLKKNKVFFFKDSTNYSLSCDRNFIRFKVLPLWKNSISKNCRSFLKKNHVQTLIDREYVYLFKNVLNKNKYNYFTN